MGTLAVRAIVAHAVGGDGQGSWHMDGWDHMMGFPYGGILMWIILVAVVALVVYLIVQSTKGGAPQSRGPDAAPGESAMDILKKRYARGEITKEEFERMKGDLLK